MAYPAPFLRLVWSGTTYPGEIFSCGLSIAQNFDGALTQPADVGPYADAVVAYHQRAGSQIASVAVLRLVKLNLVDVQGRYVNGGETFFEEIEPPVAGGAAGANPYPQLTAAITLRTARQRGLASRGRVYPPLPAGASTAGRINGGNALAMANSMATLISDLNAIGAGEVSVASKGGVNGAPGRFQPVTSVECGDIMDTQRRRRNALVESYVVATTPVVPGPS